MKRTSTLVLCLLVGLTSCGSALARGIRHYVFFGEERAKIHEKTFLQTEAFEGAQLKYTWRELEPEKDRYHFSDLRNDLAFLKSQRKRLFIQLQDTTFDPAYFDIPNYLRQDPRFHGGADPQYNIEGDNESKAVPAGWVARRWDPAVRARFRKLLFALGREFDGKIEGINLPETAVDFGESGRLYPKGFTPEKYRDSILANMKALKQAFPKSVTLQYANFMPGEWLPINDKSYLRSVYRRAKQLKVGVGGPDLLPFRKAQMNHSYPLIRSTSGSVPTGIAVQDGNPDDKNPKTGKRITLSEMLRFAQDYLKVDYIFWGTQEPFYSGELIPYLKSQK